MVTLDKKVKEFGELLARSQFPQNLKEAILANSSTLTEGAIDKMLVLLREDEKDMIAFATAMKTFENDSDTRWVEIEKKQMADADVLLGETVKQLKSE